MPRQSSLSCHLHCSSAPACLAHTHVLLFTVRCGDPPALFPTRSPPLQAPPACQPARLPSPPSPSPQRNDGDVFAEVHRLTGFMSSRLHTSTQTPLRPSPSFLLLSLSLFVTPTMPCSRSPPPPPFRPSSPIQSPRSPCRTSFDRPGWRLRRTHCPLSRVSSFFPSFFGVFAWLIIFRVGTARCAPPVALRTVRQGRGSRQPRVCWWASALRHRRASPRPPPLFHRGPCLTRSLLVSTR